MISSALPFYASGIKQDWASAIDTELPFDVSDARPVTFYSFAFRFILRASDLDDHGLYTLFSFDFVLHFPQTLVSATTNVVSNFTPSYPTVLVSSLAVT